MRQAEQTMRQRGRDYDVQQELYVLEAITSAGRVGEVGAALEVLPVEGWYDRSHQLYLQWLQEWCRRGGRLSLSEVTIALARPTQGAGKAWRGSMARRLLEANASRDRIPGTSALGHYLGELRAMWDRRRTLQALSDAQQALSRAELHEVGQGCTDALVSVREAVQRVGEGVAKAYGWDDWLQDLQTASVEGPKRRCGFGLPLLDRMAATNPSDLLVLAARPATGKTALALQGAMANAWEGRRIAVASYEMSTRQLLSRIASGEARVDSRRLADAPQELTPDEWERLLSARDRVGALQLRLSDNSRWTAEDLDRWVVGQDGVDLLIVDYLTIVPPLDRTASRERQVGETCTRLKQLAKERDCAVWLLAQLNRGSVSGQSERPPHLHDLRDSGQVEQDADRVLMGWIPDAQPGTANEPRQWLVRKNRHGPVGEALLSFDGGRQRFGLAADDVEV